MYLFVPEEGAFDPVPEDLLAHFGDLQLAMTLVLSGQRRLARADAGEVLRQLDQQGYFLQIPPTDPGPALVQRMLTS